MSLEDVRAVEALLGRRAGARAEAAHHGPLVVGQGVAVLVVFASEALGVVLTGDDRTFLRPFGLVGEHVGLQVLEDAATVRVRASPFLFDLVICLDAAQGGALLRATGPSRGDGGPPVID